jgi:2'-5' RNA ligase superfamily
MTHDYILVALLDDCQVNDTFAQWPLHVTLVPWCQPVHLQKFTDDIEVAASKYTQIDSVVGEQKTWGPNTVNVVERVPKLHELHNELLGLVRSHGELLINEQYTGMNYTPHVTHQKSLSAVEGSSITLSTIYLIDRQIATGKKTIKAKFALNGIA